MQRLMAEVRIRRRGRLEDLGDATIKAIGAGQPGGTSFMEDYTYDLTGDKHKILGAHMLEVCPTIAGDRPRRSTRSASATARTR